MADNLPATRTSASRFPATQERTPVYARITDRPPPRTEYVYVQDEGTNARRARMGVRYTGQPLKQVRVPRGVPAILGNQRIVGYAWLVAMGFIAFDEWKNNGILPRPARLWYTSLTYGILAAVGMVDAMVPLVNALAIGYTVMLIWQYYNGGGQFSK